jgi:cytochrome c
MKRWFTLTALFLGFALASAANAAPTAEQVRGRILFMHCMACHAPGSEQAGKIGPGLAGVAGATVAFREGYQYSEALQAARGRFVWTQETLGEWLASPQATLPGTSMVFNVPLSPAQLQDLWAYLETL